MQIFQVESNKLFLTMGSLLIASPLLHDYHFNRSVILMVTHNKEESMGIIMNKDFRYHISLNQLVPDLKSVSTIPVFKGGPVDRDTIFFIHTIRNLDGALYLNNGLFLNGDFQALKEYILKGNPVEGHIRFFAGYAGWNEGELQKEITENTWIIGKSNSQRLLSNHYRSLWNNSLCELGSPYDLWAKYPQYPSFN